MKTTAKWEQLKNNEKITLYLTKKDADKIYIALFYADIDLWYLLPQRHPKE